MKKLKYIGKEKNRQYPGGNWLKTGEEIEVDDGTAAAFVVLDDFELVVRENSKKKKLEY